MIQDVLSDSNRNIEGAERVMKTKAAGPVLISETGRGKPAPQVVTNSDACPVVCQPIASESMRSR
jgi:hypothetical protein